ncbi:MAG: DNA double-strand break repair nuclease NurA [Sulfurovaceae bacterium]
MEWASKISHTYVIKDDDVQSYLDKCNLPKDNNNIELDKAFVHQKGISESPIKYIITIDGGYSEVNVKKNFPSAKLAFFQFGVLLFNVEDLNNISQQPFISPEDMSKFKKIERIKFTMPVQNITYENNSSLTNSIRKTIYDFFMQNRENTSYMETLYWLAFSKYDKNQNISTYKLSSHPNSEEKNIILDTTKMTKDYKFNHIDGDLYLTDIFRLHEAVDDELGAGGVLGYLTTLFEQIILAHQIKTILERQPSYLNEILFIKDGPLAFFGQTANIHKLFRNMTNYLFKKHNLFLAGLEKSGSFTEHANEIIKNENLLPKNYYILLSNKHIYTHILPGNPDEPKPYARTSYYGAKIIFHSNNGYVYVITLPVANENVVLNPEKKDFKNIDIILSNLESLKCDMYDNSLVPIALVNQLVSLSNHPSSILLEKFSKKSLFS